jgi:DNA-directed RNA polymerase specialized sigma24 family protein
MKPVKNNKNIPQKAVLSALTDAFVVNGSYLKAFLSRFMHRKQDIEDIAQEAYIRALKVEQNGGINNPKTLLFTIAKNIALNELRS